MKKSVKLTILYMTCFVTLGLGLLAPISLAWAAYGSSLEGSRIGQEWQAISSEGQEVRAQDQQGKLHLYYFGFTQCPDICPSSLVNLMQVYDELNQAERAQLQMVFVTVDPERDTPEILQAYLASFEGDFIGLTGSQEQIAHMARQFRVKYRKIPLKNSAANATQGPKQTSSHEASADYTMEHTSQLYLLDKKAQPRLFYYSDADPIKIAQDIRAILSE